MKVIQRRVRTDRITATGLGMIDERRVNQDPFPNPQPARSKQGQKSQGAGNGQGPCQKENLFDETVNTESTKR